MFKQTSDYSSIKELLDADAKSAVEDSTFDDQLWLLLCARINSPPDLNDLPNEVGNYYASRLIQWDVGNGGFAQAAYSSPEWFLLAATGYDELGKHDAAELIREVESIIPDDSDELENLEDQFESFDGRIIDIEWEIDDLRVAYVRDNRQAFSSI